MRLILNPFSGQVYSLFISSFFFFSFFWNIHLNGIAWFGFIIFVVLELEWWICIWSWLDSVRNLRIYLNANMFDYWNVQAYLNVHGRSAEKVGGANNSSSFLKASTTTLLHTISESEKSLYVAHINSYLRDDPFLKNYLPMDPYSNDLFNLAKDGVLLWYLCRGCCALFYRTLKRISLLLQWHWPISMTMQ